MTSFFAQLSFMHVVDHQQHGLSGGPSASTEEAKSSSITDEFAFRFEVDSKTSFSEAASTPPKSKQKRFQSDLWTIRESPETVYTVAYIQMDDEMGEDGGIPVPELQPATPGVTIIEMSEEDSPQQELLQLQELSESNVEEAISHDLDLNPKDLTVSDLPENDDDVPKDLTLPPELAKENEECKEENDAVSASSEQDLKSLNERADRLCQELKRLNIEEQQSSTEDSFQNLKILENENQDEVEETKDFKEIMRQYSDFIIIMRSDDDEEEKEIQETVDTNEKKTLIEISKPEDDDNDDETINNALMVEENKTAPNIDDSVKSTKEDADLQKEVVHDAATTTVEQSNDQVETKETKTEMECVELLTDLETPEGNENKIEEQGEKNNSEDEEQKTCQSKNNEDVAELEFQEALEKLENFKPKRPRLPTSQFPDLSVEGETMARTKSNGSLHYWRMPFRHELFDRERRLSDDDPLVTYNEHFFLYVGISRKYLAIFQPLFLFFSDAERVISWYLRSNPNEDAFRFAPSGDIYSYFQRRPPFPVKLASLPLVHDMKKALGGPSWKL